MFKLRRSLLSLSLALMPLLATAQGAALPPQPTIKLTAGIHVITAEAVANRETVMRGLMFRERLAPNHGMVFLYPEKSTLCMWMRNTLIPLSVAFIDDDGTIVNVEDMEPRTDASHCARKPVRFALEMERGWFDKRGAKAGTKIGGLPKAP
jgi:uncharacterized membrane protein (UPF0127 family)